MFLGHFGLALASKKIDRRPSLGTLFLAAQFLDLLWSMFLIRNIEKVLIEPGNTVFTPLNFVFYPYSHSLFASLAWAAAFGLFYFLIKRDGRTSILLACLVVSHWVLDFFTHRPDLALSPWSAEKFGLGLWNNRPATIIIELIMFVGGTFLYTRSTSAKNKVGHFALWSFFLLMVVVYFMNAYGPPPDSVHSIAVLSVTQWLIIAWGYWIDANRIDLRNSKLVPRYEGKPT